MASIKHKYQRCVVCERIRKPNSDERVFLSKFPLEINRCKKWVKVIGQEDLVFVPIEKLHQLKSVCNQHFTLKDFNKQGNRLRRNAVPSINLPLTPLSDDILKDFPMHIGQDPKGQGQFKIIRRSPQREYTPDIIEDNDLQSSPHAADEPIPVKDKLAEPMNQQKITDGNIKSFYHHDLKDYNSHPLEFRAKIIDKFYSWLTDMHIKQCDRVKSAYILKQHQEILPEAANHPSLLRRVLTPKGPATREGIFGENLFAEHIKPVIVELYKSREMKVRLNLLDALQNYISLFTEEEVKMILLPEILIGMQDSDKMIVRATLISLAQLVDVLGPTAVIGGQRQDIFTQTEVADRETIEKTTELDDPQSIKEENDSANESEVDQDPSKRNKKRKKDILDISTQKEEEKMTELDEPQRLLNEHNDDSANESEVEHEPLDIQERNKKRKKDAWDIFRKSQVADGETIENMTESDEPLSHTWEEIEDSANESEAEQDPLDIQERNEKRKKDAWDIFRKSQEVADSDEPLSHTWEEIEDSANESEAEQDLLDINERSKKRKTNVLGLTAAINGRRQIIYKRQNS